MWLISYRYCACFKEEGRHNVRRGAPIDTVEVIDTTPELFLLEAIVNAGKISASDGRGGERFDRIEVIYFAREIDGRIGKRLQDLI